MSIFVSVGKKWKRLKDASFLPKNNLASPLTKLNPWVNLSNVQPVLELQLRLTVRVTRKGYGLRSGLLKGVGDAFIALPDFHFFPTETKIHPGKIWHRIQISEKWRFLKKLLTMLVDFSEPWFLPKLHLWSQCRKICGRRNFEQNFEPSENNLWFWIWKST